MTLRTITITIRLLLQKELKQVQPRILHLVVLLVLLVLLPLVVWCAGLSGMGLERLAKQRENFRRMRMGCEMLLGLGDARDDAGQVVQS